MFVFNSHNSIIYKTGMLAFAIDKNGDDTYPPEEQAVFVAMAHRDGPSLAWTQAQGSQSTGGNPWPWWSAPKTFRESATSVIHDMNVALRFFTGDPSPVPVITIPNGADPTTWLETQAWFIANFHFSDTPSGIDLVWGPTVVAPPVPLPTLAGIVWGGRTFVDGEAYEIGLVRNADGSRSMAVRCNVPGVGWQLVKWI